MGSTASDIDDDDTRGLGPPSITVVRGGFRASADAPRLTVAIPTCNGARHLAEALRGILAQEGASSTWSSPTTVPTTRRWPSSAPRPATARGSPSTPSGSAWRATGTVASRWAGTDWSPSSIRTTSCVPATSPAHAAAFDADPRLGLAWSAGRPDRRLRRQIVAGTAVERGGLGLGRIGLSPPAPSCRELAVGNPLRCSAVTIRADGARRGRRIRPVVPLRGRLGLLAPRRPPPAGRLARPAHGRRPMAPGERDPPLQVRDDRSRRAGPAARCPLRPGRIALARRPPTPPRRRPPPLAGLPQPGLRSPPRRRPAPGPPLPEACRRPLPPHPRHDRARPEACGPDGRPGLRPRRGESMVRASAQIDEQVRHRAAESGEDVAAVELVAALQESLRCRRSGRRRSSACSGLTTQIRETPAARKSWIFVVRLRRPSRWARSPRRRDRATIVPCPSSTRPAGSRSRRVKETSGMRTLLGSSGKI